MCGAGCAGAAAQVHYCIYPAWALPFGKLMGLLSTRYNKLFRALFLATIAPDSFVSRVMAWNVVFWTKVPPSPTLPLSQPLFISLSL